MVKNNIPSQPNKNRDECILSHEKPVNNGVTLKESKEEVVVEGS